MSVSLLKCRNPLNSAKKTLKLLPNRRRHATLVMVDRRHNFQYQGSEEIAYTLLRVWCQAKNNIVRLVNQLYSLELNGMFFVFYNKSQVVILYVP